MSQGFGSECQGIGGLLSPDNGLRRLKLTKVNLDVEECSFPDWVADTRVWNVIPRAGLRSVDFLNKIRMYLKVADEAY